MSEKLELWKRAKAAYYDINSEAIMADSEFDALERELLESGELTAENIAVGSTVRDGRFEKHTHGLRMGSLHSYHTHGSIDKFDMQEMEKICIIEKRSMVSSNYKYDGWSFSATYIDGVLKTIATRGDGFVGQDITDAVRNKMPSVINTSESYVEIRGEMVIKISTFNESYSEMYANPRNAVAGLLNSTDGSINDLDFIAYQACYKGVLGEQTFYPHPIFALKTMIPNESRWNDLIDSSVLFHDISMLPSVFEQFDEKRNDFDYMVDGVVSNFGSISNELHGKNFRHSIAWKFESEKAETKVLGIEWSLRSSMAFTPVLLVEPIELGGTTVQRVSGASFGNVNTLGAWIGATVVVEKSGDIIPHIASVSEPVTFRSFENIIDNAPENLPDFDLLYVSGAHLFTEDAALEVEIKFRKGVQKLQVFGLGEAKANELFKVQQFNTLIDIMDIALQFCDDKDSYIDYMGDKLYDIGVYDRNWEKIIPLLFDRLTSLTPQYFIKCLEIDGVGETISTEWCKEKFIEDYKSDRSHHKSFLSIVNSDIVNENISSYIEIFDMSDYIVNEDDSNDGAETMDVCLTGSPKPNWKTKKVFLEEINGRGGTQYTDVKINNAEMLITDDLSSTSSKMKKAQKMGIPIKLYTDI